MAVEYETYELGKDVTQIAKTGTKLQTAIISVRLTKAEAARLLDLDVKTIRNKLKSCGQI